MVLEIIFQITIAAVITERALEGLHRFYLTRKLKVYLVGDNDGGGVLSGWKREFVRCKFCQSFWVGWAISLLVVLFWGGWSWHWVWMGLVAGWLANRLHDLGHALSAARYIFFRD